MSRDFAAHHLEIGGHMSDILFLLLISLGSCRPSMEFVFIQEGVDELPVGAFGDLEVSLRSDLIEILLRIDEFMLRPDIIEIRILDDLFEESIRMREEDGRHDDILDFLDSIEWMILFHEPFPSNLRSVVFIFPVLYRESSIMKEGSELEIFEVFIRDSLSESEIGRSLIDSPCMVRIMIGVVGTDLEEVEDIESRLRDDRRESHRKERLRSMD